MSAYYFFIEVYLLEVLTHSEIGSLQIAQNKLKSLDKKLNNEEFVSSSLKNLLKSLSKYINEQQTSEQLITMLKIFDKELKEHNLLYKNELYFFQKWLKSKNKKK